MKQNLLAFGALFLLAAGNVAAAEVKVAPEPGADITTALANAIADVADKSDIVIDLAQGGSYTVSGSLEVPGAITINGNGAYVDASALTAPFVLMSTTPAVEAGENGFYTIGNVAFNNLNVTGLGQQFFYANKTKYYIPEFTTNGCDIRLTGGNKNIYDFQSGGVVKDFTITASTISSYPANTGTLYSSQSGNRVTEVNADYIQTLTIDKSTLYNIAYQKNLCTHRQNSQKWLTFNVTKSILIDCGKQGQFVLGFNGGGSSTNPTFDVDTNSFLWGTPGDFAIQPEKEPSEGLFKNTLGGPTSTFAQANAGIFTLNQWSSQAEAQVGAPEWLVPYVAPIEIPEGTELSAFVKENIVDGDKNLVTFMLAPGATYELTDIADLKIANIAFFGDGSNRPLVKISGNGTFLSQNGIEFKNINFDMTEAPVTSFITITANPDSCFSTKYLGLTELGTREGFIYENPIAIESCDFKNLPGSIIYTAQINGGNSGWGFKNISIVNSIVQFNKQNNKAAISLEDNWMASGIVNLNLANSTFYNLGNYKARFLRYGARTKPEQIFLPGTTINHTFSHCTFSKTFTDDQFANNMDNSGLVATIDHCIFYDINRLDQYCFRNGTSQVSSDNIAWLGGSENKVHGNVEKMAEVVNPEFAGPIDRPYALDEEFGGVNFRAMAHAADSLQCGDPRWFKAPAGVPVTVVPDGTELSAFVAEHVADNSKAYYRFELAGTNYELTDTANLKIAQVAFIGADTVSTVLKISGNGAFMTQNGVELKNLHIDMTEAPLSSLIMMSNQPDSVFFSRTLTGDSTLVDGFLALNPIMIKDCEIRNLPSSIIINNGPGWGVKNFSIENTVVQLDKKNSTGVIDFSSWLGEDWNHSAQIKEMSFKNSTFYNTSGNVKTYFVKYINKNNCKAPKLFGEGAVSHFNFDNCTFHATFLQGGWGDRLPTDNSLVVTINNSILSDISRPDKLKSDLKGSNNMAWGAGYDGENAQTMRGEVEKIAYIQNPTFVGPTDLAYDFAEEFGGVNFRPYNELCISKKIGDPRWFNAPAPALSMEIPDGSELAAFVKENVPESATVPMTFTMLPGANYTLVDTADIKLANIAFVGDAENRALVTVTGSGLFMVQSGLQLSNINFDLTNAPETDPVVTFATDANKAFFKDTINGAASFVSLGTVSFTACDFRNLPGSIISQGATPWALKSFVMDNCVVQFNKKNSKAAIAWDNRWEFGSILNLTLKSSTFYNTGTSNNAYFVRFGMKRPDRFKNAFGEDAKGNHVIDACTFYKTFTDKDFGNNMPEGNASTPETNPLTVTVNNTIFYDVNRVQKYISQDGKINTVSDKNNMVWLAGNNDGVAEGVHSNVKAIAIEENPDFVGPVDLPFDLAEEFGGVNFCPQNETAKTNKIGDPRWFDAQTEIVVINTDETTVDGPVEYFNLQGVRVAADNLVPGIYVKRQGNKTSKVYVK